RHSSVVHPLNLLPLVSRTFARPRHLRPAKKCAAVWKWVRAACELHRACSPWASAIVALASYRTMTLADNRVTGVVNAAHSRSANRLSPLLLAGMISMVVI